MPLPDALRGIRLAKAIVFLVGLVPLVGVMLELVLDPPVDPYEELAHTTGEFALRFLLITLLVTPVKDLTGWKRAGAFRRTFGVLAFTYALAHFLAYQILEAGFDPAYFIDDLAERRFILFGGIAFLLMLPLGLTSNNWSVGKLGGKAWKKLHWLVFPIAIISAIHFLQTIRGDQTEGFVYLGIFVVLILYRLVKYVRRKRQAATAA